MPIDIRAGRVLALDSGKNKVYGAYGLNGKITELRAFDPDDSDDYIHVLDLTVLEKVNINANTPNWQSTLDCGLAGECVAGRMRTPIKRYTPSQWKGSLKKPTYHWLLWTKCLTGSEQNLFPADTYTIIRVAAQTVAATGRVKNYAFENHNFLDAAGLFCFEHKRIGRGGGRVAT